LFVRGVRVCVTVAFVSRVNLDACILPVCLGRVLDSKIRLLRG
jgi:hypothetical protein